MQALMGRRTLSGAALPPGLADLEDPPTRLFVHGSLPRGPCVGIVGTRDPSPEARDYASELAFRLAGSGVSIISGGAEGIDAAAHRGALEARGVTLVVAPSSFEHPYPERHGELFARIVASGGAHVSVFRRGVQPRRHQFFRRNSILVALSHAIIVVEAPLRSGARNAAKWARELGRPCFIVPAAPWNPRGLGNIAELQLGGRVLVSHEQILRLLAERQLHAVTVPSVAPEEPDERDEPGAASSPVSRSTANAEPPAERQPGSRRTRERCRAGASPLEHAILLAIEAGARTADQIGCRACLSAAEVSHGLLLLTLKGEVRQGLGGELTVAR
jgi:DNA processing protein